MQDKDKYHRLGNKLWFAGGLIWFLSVAVWLVCFSLYVSNSMPFFVIMIVLAFAFLGASLMIFSLFLSSIGRL